MSDRAFLWRPSTIVLWFDLDGSEFVEADYRAPLRSLLVERFDAFFCVVCRIVGSLPGPGSLISNLSILQDPTDDVVTDRLNQSLFNQKIPQLPQGPLVERTAKGLGRRCRDFCDQGLLFFCQTAWPTGLRFLAKCIKALVVEVTNQFPEILLVHLEIGSNLLNTHPLTTEGNDLSSAHLNPVTGIP